MLQVANPSSTAVMRRALREFAPDVVHVVMMLPYLSPAVLAPLRSVPTTMIPPDLKVVCPKGTKLLPDGSQCRVPMGAVCRREGCLSAPRATRDAVRYRAFRLGLRHVDRVLAVSAHLAAELEHVGIPATHVPLPVPAPTGPLRRTPRECPHFVFAGRLAPVKGLDLLIDAFASLLERRPGVTLRICGDGPERSRLEQRVGRLGLSRSISFRRGMPWDWTSELEDAWALVAPSLYREPLGLVAIEAIVRDVPVIASADGGFGESVADGRSGLLFANGDAAGLLDRMTMVCDGAFPDHRPERAARDELAARHRVEDHVRTMERIWREIGP